MSEQRYICWNFPCYLFLVSHCTTRLSNMWIRAVRQVCELLELFTQSELDDTGSAGCRRCRRVWMGVQNCHICQCSFCTVGYTVLVTHSLSMVWVTALELICSFVLVLLFLVTPNITLLPFSKCWQIKLQSIKVVTSETVVRVCAQTTSGGKTHQAASMSWKNSNKGGRKRLHS